MSATDRPATRLWREALEQLDQLLQLSPDRRSSVLGELQQSKPQLHSVVSSLLEAEARADSAGFLEPDAEPATFVLREGAQLGPYRIRSQIGAGGMGEVWSASREDGLYQGEVAIKTLHPYFGSGALRERFLREAQILGRLQHPNIARLLDAGTAADGSVYLVLEYVRGDCIDSWCNERKLPVGGRLQLFLDVCAAVAQAHANLVVHRDIKPSNILVTAESQVKLLDFGVAKLLEAEATPERAELTRMTGRIFTPEYAAPEQILGETITTSADVYSLGVLLHVLLTDSRPYAQSGNPVEIEHAVLHADPVRASQAVTPDSAAARGTTPPKLVRALSGDLDNIVARALCKAPAERYPSVLAFADDVRRHLAHQPIVATPGSLATRAGKFIRRHRLGVAASTLVMLVIGVAIVGVLWQAQVARTESRKATAIKDFLVGIFEHNSASHPDGAKAQQTTAAELLNQGAKQIRTGLTDAPEARAELLGVMAQLYADMEMPKESLPLLEEQLGTRRRLLGEAHPDVARTLTHLAHSNLLSGKYAEAERLASQAQKIFEASDATTALEYALTWFLIGQVKYRTGKFLDGDSFRYFRTGLDLVVAHHPSDQTRLLMLSGLSRAAQSLGKQEEALKYSEERVRLIESGEVEADGLDRGGAYQSYGDRLSRAARNDEAERYLRKAIDEYRRAGGEDHPFVSDGKRALGMSLAWSGRRAEARELLQGALATQERMRGQADPRLTAVIRLDLGRVLMLRGEFPAAEEQLLRVVDAFRGSNQPVENVLIQLGRLHTDQGRFDAATRDLEGIDEISAKMYGPDSRYHSNALLRLGYLKLAQGRLPEAVHYFRRTDAEDGLPGMSPDRAAARVGMLRIDMLKHDPLMVDRARELLTGIESARMRGEMPDEEAAAHLFLGVALTRAGKFQEAQPHIEQALASRERMDAPESPYLAECRLALAQLRHLAGQREAARKLYEQAAQAHQTQQLGPQHRVLLAQTREVLAH